MTDSERADYNKLNADQREDYDYFRRKHPEWSHEELMSRISVGSSIDNMLKGGGTKKPEGIKGDPTFIERVLKGARNILRDMGIDNPMIFEVLDNAIRNLAALIRRGISYIGDLLESIWSRL